MASPEFSPISEDGEAAEAPQGAPPPEGGPPAFPASAFAAVAAAAAALSEPALPLPAEGEEDIQSSAFAAEEAAAVSFERSSSSQALPPPWSPQGTVLLLPPPPASPSRVSSFASRDGDACAMELDSPTHAHARALPHKVSLPAQLRPASRNPQQRNGAGTPSPATSVAPPVAATSPTLPPPHASVETAASFIYRFAAAIPPPAVAAAAAAAASRAAAAASREAAAAAAATAAASLVTAAPSPAAVRALSRTAGAQAAAAAAAAAGALPLSICYLLLDAYRRSPPKQKLAIFYVFHRLLQLSAAARANAEVPTIAGSLEDAAYSIFVIPALQEIQASGPEMLSIRPKMLRCLSIWRDWCVYSPEALRHIRQLAAKGEGSRVMEEADKGDAAAVEMCGTPPLASVEALEAVAAAAATAAQEAGAGGNRNSGSSFAASQPAVRTAAAATASEGGKADAGSIPAPDEGTGDAAGGGRLSPQATADAVDSSKRHKTVTGSWRNVHQEASSECLAEACQDGAQGEPSNAEFSMPFLRQLSAEQLAACGKLFDRASRVTGQEYLLLQSSLMDLSGLLQMQHQRLLELREEMQLFAAADALAGSDTQKESAAAARPASAKPSPAFFAHLKAAAYATELPAPAPLSLATQQGLASSALKASSKLEPRLAPALLESVASSKKQQITGSRSTRGGGRAGKGAAVKR
ncbi:ice-structuring glycoprotein [Cyclospora cayetanensis]|uniref:Ice-structuring glycoprotein n=1 Tax=Cyclospora cayetanensis TaxID=88456 RepID=A0A6P6RWC6_9EIME|nr:ice-structuring glycoprotein [Cyclospora cayetanensis]